MWQPTLYPHARVLFAHDGRPAPDIIIACLGRIGVKKIETIDQLSRAGPSLIYSGITSMVIDIDTPTPDYFSLIAHVRQRKTPVTTIVTTSDNRASSINQVLAGNVSAIIIKPFSFKIFAERFSLAHTISQSAGMDDTHGHGIEIMKNTKKLSDKLQVSA